MNLINLSRIRRPQLRHRVLLLNALKVVHTSGLATVEVNSGVSVS
jgi:hypothetical protein